LLHLPSVHAWPAAPAQPWSAVGHALAQQRLPIAPMIAGHRRGLIAHPTLLYSSRPTVAPPQGLDHLMLALAPHIHLLLLSLKGRSGYEATTPPPSRLFMRQCEMLTSVLIACYRGQWDRRKRQDECGGPYERDP